MCYRVRSHPPLALGPGFPLIVVPEERPRRAGGTCVVMPPPPFDNELTEDGVRGRDGAPGQTGTKKEMEQLYVEGIATHDGPEPCAGATTSAKS